MSEDRAAVSMHRGVKIEGWRPAKSEVAGRECSPLVPKLCPCKGSDRGTPELLVSDSFG